MDPLDELREDVEHLKSALNMLADAVFLSEEERKNDVKRCTPKNHDTRGVSYL